MHTIKARITEIFSSIQGEGIFLGAKQIFIRFKECNLDCDFCDERKDLEPKEYTAHELVSEIKYLDLAQGPHHSVSLTGGEPLLYAGFLDTFLPNLKKNRFKTYLETNGTLPDELAKVIRQIDIISMDFKLPSATLERPFWKEHLRFLKIASGKKVFVKVVVTPQTDAADVKKAVGLIRKIDRSIPFIIQPATPVGPEDGEVEKSALWRFVEMGTSKKLENVRVIPQVHKILNVK